MAILERPLKHLTALSLAPVQLLVIPAQRFLQLQIMHLSIRRSIKLYLRLQMLDYSPKSQLIKTHTQTLLYNSRRPSKALAKVTSSAYSRSPPMGNPKAIRVTLVKGFSKPPIYKVVVSPSTLGLIAKITS